MNCRNCAAPLKTTPFSDHAECPHCGTSHALRLLEEGLDRVIWGAEPTGTNCPRCDDDLVTATLEGNSAQACPQCRGVLISNAAFGGIVRQRRAEYRGAEFIPRPVDLDDLTEPVYCPNCQRTMEVHPYYGPGNQIIDSCCRCSLVWIDSGELTAIEKAAGARG